MTERKSTQTIFLILQIIITLFYLAMIVHMTVILYEKNPNDFIYQMISYLPQVVVLISSLIPQIALRLRRKLHSQDGEIFPLLFTMVALQASLIIPQYTLVTGVFIIDQHLLIIIERFSLLGTSALFLISSLRYYGFNSSKIGWYTVCVLGFALFLCIIAPTSSVPIYYTDSVNSYYDVYIQLAIAILYLATILTFFVAFIKDKTNTNIRRLVGFSIVIIGLYMAISSSLIPVIISCILYLSGIIVLAVNTRESF